MTEITINLDVKASQSMHELMSYYGVKSKAAIISKAMALLKTATYISKTNGELLARKGSHETKIVIS
jgi:hypothetical protein